MKKTHFIAPIVAAGLFTCAGCVYAAPTTIVTQGKSTFSIVVPNNAPSSIQAAAKELQQDIAKSTGATLPISKEDSATGHVISLGETSQAKAAGIDLNGVGEEGYRIVTKNDNIYILGTDTADGALTKNGGTSNGTANGVYSFLEDYLGVRWLMPGALGLDVPVKSTFIVDDINKTDTPFFINRREPYIQNTLPSVEKWQDQQKLGYSFRIEHSHNWTQTVKPELFKDHPDWFPMIDGKRMPPSGRYKLETTNPGLVNYFAQAAVDSLKANPQSNTFSLSPSDSRGWSQSAESKALYDPPPPGEKFPSVTPLILKFYRDVAEIVAKEDPNAKLAGYIYADYLYPPQKGGMTLPDNFYPVIAPSIDYGFTLYRPDVQHDFNNLMEEWGKVTPHLFYYDLPNDLSSGTGIITPPATEILNYIFPRLVKNNVKGVYIYGTAAWSQTALANYILAKMEWNPNLNANDLQHDWLMRAYGPQAGAKMETFYQKVDGWFRDYYQQNQDASYTLNDKILQGLYAPHYPELEQLFLDAKSQTMTPIQQQRLQLMEDNMVVLEWRLKNAKLLPAGFQSKIAKSDDEVVTLMTRANSDFEMFPGMVESGPKVSSVKVTAAPAIATQEKSPQVRLRDANMFLLYSAKGGEITITPSEARNGRPFISYVLKDAKNTQLLSGILTKGKPITFEATANTPYFLYINSGIYTLSIDGAGAAVQTNSEESRLHLFGSPATLYYYVPANSPKWTLMLASESPGETAHATIYSPDGKQAAELDTAVQPAQTANLNGQSGFWKVDISKAKSGVLDDIYLQIDSDMPHWININPAEPLEIK
jgi:hypothetical protein